MHYVPPYYGSHCSLIHDPTVRGDGAHQERSRKARELNYTKFCPAWPWMIVGQAETEANLQETGQNNKEIAPQVDKITCTLRSSGIYHPIQLGSI